ncbi:MAG: diheme cytochrome c [Burkholderiaceae bacterium]
MKTPAFTPWLLAGLLAAALPLSAHADSRNLLPRNELKLYNQECAACHLAYPPGMLPAASWQRMMGSLDKHYGSDASLDAASVKQIGTWLQTHAGTYKRVQTAGTPPDDRITRSAWFERKHRKIDSPQVWKHASVKSAANCMACHTAADKGNYDDNGVQFPKGLDERFRAAFLDD